jgi:hypothetical protein
MKKILFFLIGLIFFNAVFSQTKEEHLQKSRRLKTTAWILTGTGAALTIGGSILVVDGALKNNDHHGSGSDDASVTEIVAGAGLTVLGLASVGVSIPFFIRAHKENKRAMTFSFKNENIPLVRNGRFARQVYPALALHIRL